MATFNIPIGATYKWDDNAFSTRVGNDSYNLVNSNLTIYCDTRYCKNSDATKGTVGVVAIDTSYGGIFTIDGTKVRIIPFNSGTGNVPAIGTTISKGAVSGELLGVWSALNVPPTTAGSAMPTSGWIKVRSLNGAITAGALTGIGASATGADRVGWIEVIGVESKVVSLSDTGTVNITGEWYYPVETTSGTANQTIQLPASVANTYYMGVWIETGVGTDQYEFYPRNTNVATDTPTDSYRGKMVWISTQGLLRIGNDGTNTVGYVPVAGCKIRVPNVNINATTTTNLAVNVVPNSTLTNGYRWCIYPNASGNVYIDKANLTSGYFYQPNHLSVTNCTVADQVNIGTPSSAFVIDNVHVTPVNASATVNFFYVNYALKGGSYNNCSGFKTVTTYQVFNINRCKNITITNCKSHFGVRTTGADLLKLNYCEDTTIDNYIQIGGTMTVTSSNRCSVKNVKHCEQPKGNLTGTATSQAISVAFSTDTLVEGFSLYGDTTYSTPSFPVFYINQDTRTTIQNVGTQESPLDFGTFNRAYNPAFLVQSYGGSIDAKVRRVFIKNGTLRTTAIMWDAAPSSTGILFQNVTSDYTANFVKFLSNNTVFKGISSSNAPVTSLSCYGSHFYDTFTSDTAGMIGVAYNPASTESQPYITENSVAGNKLYNALGRAVLTSVGDYIIHEFPHFVVGHSSLQGTVPLKAYVTNSANFKIEFQYDIGSGFNGTWLDSAVTSNMSSIVIPDTGIKLKIKTICITANVGNNIGFVSFLTNTSLAYRASHMYPMDYGTITFTGLPDNTEVRMYDDSDNEIAGVENSSGGSVALTYEYTGNKTARCVFASIGYNYLSFDYTLDGTNVSIPVQLVADRWYNNP